MTKTTVVLFAVFVLCIVNAGKEGTEKLEEIEDSVESIKSDDDEEEDESASIQVVHRDVVNEKAHKLLNDNIPHKEYSKVLKENNSTKASVNNYFDDYVSDESDDIILENPDDKIEKILIPSGSSVEENINDYSNQQEELEIVEHITIAYNDNENNKEDNSALNEDENNWRSAENIQSDVKEYSADGANEEISLEDEGSVEDYMDKNMGTRVRDRMEIRQPERREHYTRPIDTRHYGPPDVLDSGPTRSFAEIVVPRYRPKLTRNGIVYTPTLYTVQTGSPLLDRLAGRNWIQNRPHMNPDRDYHTRPGHNRVMGLPQPRYEDSKMIDDYNDYGTNTYSYTPVMKATTQAPPQQIKSPNKFDVFQKLVEASNQPNLGKRAFNDNMFPSNYYPQRQYPESYGPYDVRRFSRNAWDELPFEDNI